MDLLLRISQDQNRGVDRIAILFEDSREETSSFRLLEEFNFCRCNTEVLVFLTPSLFLSQQYVLNPAHASNLSDFPFLLYLSDFLFNPHLGESSVFKGLWLHWALLVNPRIVYFSINWLATLITFAKSLWPCNVKYPQIWQWRWRSWGPQLCLPPLVLFF